MKPLKNKIYAQLVVPEEKTSASGIILTASPEDGATAYAEVVNVGSECVEVAVGDVIVFAKNMAFHQKDGSVIIKETDVLAVCEA